MAAESSELPTHYGGKSADGEVVTRANQDLSVAPLPLRSPSRAYDRSRRLSPQVATIDFEFVPGDRDDRPRRRQSTQPRRYSNTAESDRPYFSESRDSQGQLRARDDGYYRYREDDRDYRQEPRRDIGGHERERERERDDYRHPDSYDSRRPPRAFRNFDQETYDYSRSSKPTFKYTDRDVEPRTLLTPQRRGRFPDEEESIDGYNYEGHKTRATLDFANLTKEQKAAMMRLPWTQWMNSSFKNHFVATIGEFVGTTMFLFFAFAGTQVANVQSAASSSSTSTSGTTSGAATGFNISVLLYISVIFGFSLMVNVWVFFRISGGLFNPAVTLAMVLTGAMPLTRAVFLFFAQIAGGIAASAMVLGLFPTALNVRTTLAADASLVQGIFIEAILTAELVFTIFMLAKEKHKATFIAPVGIGLALFIAEMVGVYYTGGSLNPARSFGPCVVTWTWDKEHWIYWVGPIIGSLIAVFFYKFIKMLEYEMANPGQDGDMINDPTKNKEKHASMRAESHAGQMSRM